MDMNQIIRGLKRRSREFLRIVTTGKTGPRMVSCHTMTDSEFINLLDINAAQKYLHLGDIESAKSAVIAHFKNRTTPIWPKPSGTLTDLRLDLECLPSKSLIQKANSIIEMQISPDGRIPKLKNDGNIAWDENLTSTPEWLWRLNRHAWWPVLGLAYELTEDEKYAIAFEKQMRNWILTCPPPKKIDERSAHWRLMEAALRMRVSWIPSFALFFKSNNFSLDSKLAMLRSIYDHAKFISLFSTTLNHLLREINGLISVSLYFPEFKESKDWLAISQQRLEGEIRKQISLDGSHVEVSTGYQWLVIDELESVYDLLKNSNVYNPIIYSLASILQKMYEVLVYVIRPDLTFPEINDGFLRWNHSRMTKAAAKFNRKDFLYIGSGGKAGNTPERLSKSFDNAGWYIMRSDWTKNARYLFFDAGPHGGNHGHEDKLSIELSAFGQSFVVDPGSYTYEKADPFRTYFVGSQGHNTVLVNGLGQIRRWIKEQYINENGKQKEVTWVSNNTCDYVSATYSGAYANFKFSKPRQGSIIKDVTHTRHIIFAKPDYWIMADELNATNQYTYELLFHTPPGVNVIEKTDQQMVFSNSEDGPSLRIIPIEHELVSVCKISGAESPIQGWHSLDHLKKIQSNVVIYSSKSEKNLLLLTLLIPQKNEDPEKEITVEQMTIIGGSGKAFRLTIGEKNDYFLISKDSGIKKIGNFESTGNVLLIRNDRELQRLRRFDWRW